MADALYGKRSEGERRWARVLDDGLIWVRPVYPTGNRSRQQAWHPALGQQLADLHARYERACLEE